MPFLQFFADEHDGEILLSRLNGDDDIAFIIEDKTYTGHGRRVKAVHTLDRFSSENYSLWHIPAGALPLDSVKNTWVVDPWDGWIAEHWTNDGGPSCSRTPYFGNHFAEIHLKLWLRHQPYTDTERATPLPLWSYYTGDTDLLPVSGFQWIGNKSVSPVTWDWWYRLTEWMSNHAIPIGKFELNKRSKEWSFWAFPSAFNKLKSGMAYEANGYDLTDAIQNASCNS
jgi:hypothetical protein